MAADASDQSKILRPLKLLVSRFSDWVERKPREAWLAAFTLVLFLAAIESLYWPVMDYPGAIWHPNPWTATDRFPRGADIEIFQSAALKAGPRDMLGYWYGPMIGAEYGNMGKYRPLTSCLWVIEARLFGSNDARWCSISLLLHVSVIATLFFAAAALTTGATPKRVAAATLAGLIAGAPFLSSRELEKWMVGWWPSQDISLSLLFGLLMLASVGMYFREHGRRWLIGAVAAFALSVFAKENGYIAGVGGCLLCIRKREWRLFSAIAIAGVLLIGLKMLAVKGPGEIPPLPQAEQLLALFGNPDSWQDVALVVLGAAVQMILIWGVWLANWPAWELAATYLISRLIVLGWPPQYTYYRYWGYMFGAIVAGIALVTLLDRRGKLPVD